MRKLTAPKMRTLDYYTGQAVFPIWGEVKGLLHKAAEHSRGEWKTSDVLAKSVCEQQQIWVFRVAGQVQAVAVTEFVVYPRKTACNIYAMAGFGIADLWKEFSGKLLVWLEDHGVSHVETTCRDEVMEKLIPLGFQKKANVLHFNWKETP